MLMVGHGGHRRGAVVAAQLTPALRWFQVGLTRATRAHLVDGHLTGVWAVVSLAMQN